MSDEIRDFGLNNIEVGDRIWRPVAVFVAYPVPSKTILSVNFKKTEKNSYMCWVYKDEKIIDKFKYYAQDFGKGLVCFLKEKPDDDKWTCLQVTGKSKNGKAIFARAVNGDKDELLSVWEEVVTKNGD